MADTTTPADATAPAENQTPATAPVAPEATAPTTDVAPSADSQGEQVPVTVKSEAPASSDTSSEAESASEDAGEGSEEAAPAAPAEVAAPEAPSEPVAPAHGAAVQPVAVKDALNSLHSDISAVVEKLKGSEVAAAHDIEDILGLLEGAKHWVAEKVAVYDPALGKDLGVDTTTQA